MAEKLNPNQVVTLEAMVIARMLEQETLISRLDRKGLLTRAEALDEVRRLRERAARAR